MVSRGGLILEINLERDVLLLDGDCGLCHRLALFMDPRLDSSSDIAYRQIESEESRELISRLPVWKQEADTVYLFRDGRAFVRSAAAIRCLLYLKWHWKIWFPLLWVIPLPVRDIVYRVIAKYRYRFFARPEICTFRID